MTLLALMRHGHTGWNREGRLQGRTDIPLDDAARAELARHRLPPDWARARLVSSPLQRAMETARIIGGRAPETVPALIEMNWGAWEGGFGAALRADSTSGYRDIEHWGWDFRPPDGESVAEVRDRVLPWAQALTGPTLAICHIGIMRVLLACATGWNFRGPPPFAVKRNRLYLLSVPDRTPSGALSWDGSPLRLERTE